MKMTMTRKVGEGTFWLTGSSFLIKIIGILYTILVLSQLSVSDYGLLELAMSVPLLLGFFNLAGLQPVIIADLVSLHTKQEHALMRDLFSSYVSLRIFLSVLVSASLFMVTLYLEPYFPEVSIFMVQLLCVALLFGPLRSIVSICLNLAHNFRGIAALSFLEELLKIILVGIFLLSFNMGPAGVILAYVITDVVVSIFFVPAIFLIRNKYFLGIFFSQGLFKPLSVLENHAKWSVLQSGLHQFGQNIRPWIIQFFLGTQAVGLYALAFGMYQHVASLFPLSRVIAPIVPTFSDQSERLIRFTNVSIKYDMIVQFFIAILAVLTIPFLINYAFPSYYGAYPLFLVLLLGLIPNSFSRIYEAVFQSLRLQKNLFTSNLVKMASTAVILPITVIFFGIYGIALEFIITSTMYSLGRYRVLKRVLREYYFSFKIFISLTQTDKFIIEKIKSKLSNHVSFLKI